MTATEEAVTPASVEAPPPATEEPNKPEEKTKKKPAREKKLNDLKEPKKKPKQTKVTKPKTADSHPPYFQMIKEALLALKEKSGSSPYAIAKYMEEKHKALPANFRKTLTLQLKNSEEKGKLTKVKASYKLTEAGKKDKSVEKRATRASSQPKKEKKKTRTTTGAAKKKKQVMKGKKPKQPKSIKSPAAKKPKKSAA